MNGKPFCAASIVIFGGTGDLAGRKLIPALAVSMMPACCHMIFMFL